MRAAWAAWAACPKGTPGMLMRDRLDVVFEDEGFADLYPKDGRRGLSPGQLALVSVLQFAENLSDHTAANAVRTRIDLKYALRLELGDPDFDHSVLCEFRAWLAWGDAADRLLQMMLHRLTEAGLLTSGGWQRTRCDPCAGGGAHTEPAGAGRREPAVRPRTARPGGPGLAARAGGTGVGRALRAQGRHR